MTTIRGAVATFGLLCTVWLLGMPITGGAQGSTEVRTFGTTSDVVYTIPAAAFSNPLFAVIGGAPSYWSCAAGFSQCVVAAGVFLPAGAVVTRIELDACLGQKIQFALNRVPRSNINPDSIEIVSTDDFDVVPPACTIFPRNLSSPMVIDNLNFYYFVTGLINADTQLLGGRIVYHLQVSPSPAVATFSDVPVGHPQHQYIEALVASGITAGCGGGNYCPDAPLTRGQMAVFLSKGLGLHFAP